MNKYTKYNQTLFTGLPALIAILYTMDRLTEPWKQD